MSKCWIQFLPSDPVENETTREPAGLPSALLEPQEALVDEEQHDLTEGDTRNVSLLTNHLTKTNLEENKFPGTKVYNNFFIFCLYFAYLIIWHWDWPTVFYLLTLLDYMYYFISLVKHDGSQMSEESTIKEDFKRPLDVSKLFSNSCNSLGSMEGQPDPILSHQE